MQREWLGEVCGVREVQVMVQEVYVCEGETSLCLPC